MSFFRGTDSAGVAIITKKKLHTNHMNHTIRKGVDHAVDFFMQKHVLSEIHNNKAVCLMGHARAATHGDINETNAQPVREGHIIGTHNGVLKKYEPSKYETADFTDSRKLFVEFSKTGADAPKILNDLWPNDSYALVWVDTVKNTINFVRNDRRPLYLCRSDGKALFWSSSLEMIAFALIRNSVTYDEIKEVPEGVLLSVNMTTGESSTVILKEKPSPFIGLPNRVSVHTTQRGDTSVQRAASTETSVPIVGPVARVRVVPSGELLGESMQAAKSHSPLQEFMNITSRNRVIVQSSALIQDNVIPFVTREENEAVVKEAERRYAEFLERPKVSDASSHNMDKASYRLRKYGIEQWVSIPVAESHLRHGCKTCNAKPSVEDKVFWKDPSNFYCDECFRDDNIRDYMKIKDEDYVESDIMLDTHVSMYGG